MKINRNYIKALALVGLIVFLYGFSDRRNAERKIRKVHIEFTNGKNLFITKETVNNLLIVSDAPLEKVSKDSVDLNRLENKLNNNPMIARADVFETIKGDLGTVITQRQPYARVVGQPSFYIDSRGKAMPLSENYSARVPLESGVIKENLTTVFPLVEKIEKDGFLRRHVTAIRKERDGDYILKLRQRPFVVNFGEIKDINQKIRNFKAFYKEAKSTEKLNQYSRVNLKFAHQVVCTKKKV